MARAGAVCLGLLAAGAGACAGPRVILPATARAHAIVFPGITGPFWGTERFVGLIEREVPSTSAQVFDWTSLCEHRLALGNLTEHALNLTRAGQIARQLVEWRNAHPDTKLFLIGHSGGVGMILLVCDALPDTFRLEGIVLLSGAVEPGFDLTKALSLARRGVLAYSSRADVAVLNLGTRLFGTIDRVHGPSAGYAGFRIPEDHASARKLQQIRWTPADILLGNLGGHPWGLAPAYCRRRVLPFLTTETAEEQPPPAQNYSVR